MASGQLSKDVILKMAKPDLENVCMELMLPSTGTIKELRAQLLDHLDEVDHSESLNVDEGNGSGNGVKSERAVKEMVQESVVSEKVLHQKVEGQSSDSTMSMFLKWMMKQEEQRAEDKREENRRWENVMKTMEESQQLLLNKLLTPQAHIQSHDSGSSIPAVGYLNVKRSVDRWETEIQSLIDQTQRGIRDCKAKEMIQNLTDRLLKYDAKLNKVLDDNIDQMDGDEKEELVKQIIHMISDINSVYTQGAVYVNKVKEAELEKSRTGPLPSGTEIPKFDGNVLHFRQWWEHFKSLIHENKSVGKFWKMRYLLNAMEGSRSSVLAGKKGLEEEYDEAIDIVQKKFGKKHAVVRQLVNTIVTTATPMKEAVSFGNFVDEVKSQLSALEAHNVSRDMVVMPLLENRLPASIRMEWEREVCFIVDQGKQPSTNDLVKFLEVEHEAICAHSLLKSDKGDKMSEVKPALSKERVITAQSLVTFQKQEEEVKRPKRCFDCEGDHVILDCTSFKNRDKEDRRRVAREMRLCFRCLKFTYTPWHRCRRTACTLCRNFHHELLSCPSDEKPEESTSLSVIMNEGNEVLPTVLARAKFGNREIIVRLGLDSMSQKTFVASSLVDKLGLKSVGQKVITVQGFGGICSREKVDIVEIDLLPIDKEEAPIVIDAFVKKGEVCAPLSAVTVRKTDYPHLQNLALSDPEVPEGGEIDILIGQAPLQEIVQDCIIRPKGGGRQPSAWKTRFGYALMGPLPGNTTHCNTLCTSVPAETSLESKLEMFWLLDTMGIVDIERKLSPEEQAAVDTFNKEMSYNNERYTVPLPFKENTPQLENNYARVLGQLKCTERRLMKNPELMGQYQKAMKEYELRGFASELTADEIQEFGVNHQYLIPHHAVIKQSSVSTKCRVVFNASDPDRNGNSVNSCLLPGPALQPDLGGVLLRFRTHRIVLTGDIEKMFMQTKVLPKYYRYQQYLWRDCDVSAEPRRMVMTRLMFGVSSSQFFAIKSTHQHAENKEQMHLHPDICKKVKTSLYVDDWQSGEDSEDAVIKQYNDAVAFIKSGGWRLTKFASNSASVLQVIPSNDIHPHAVVELDEREDEHGAMPTALGLTWDTQDDCLYVSVSTQLTDNHLVSNRFISKRIALSTLSSVYDVFGFFSAYMITVKFLMQDIWHLKVGWDDDLPQHIRNVFVKWTSELDEIKNIPVPRFMLKNGKNKKVSLHGFCDASEKAYGAIIYVRFEDANDTIQTTFVMSKSRVAPLKTQTIARLELMAALILAKLMIFVIDQCTMAGSDLELSDVHLWSDSEIVLAWISKPSSTWKLNVRNRVEQIQQLSQAMTWNHCPGKDNPSDLVSTSATLKDLAQNNFYWHGPQWIKHARSEWPMNTCSRKAENEDLDAEDFDKERSTVVMSTQTEEIDSPPSCVLRSSRFLKTKRIYAWVMCFVDNVTGGKNAGDLSSDEVMRAETLLLLDLQKRHFRRELNAVYRDSPLPPNSPLLGYDPFIDEQSGLLRVGGLLQHSDLPDMVRHPSILPAQDILTQQIVQHLHVQGHHAAHRNSYRSDCWSRWPYKNG